MNKNIVWHTSRISKNEREKLKNHKGACIWLTGLPASGKSTIANLVEQILYSKGIHTYILDGDNVRHGLNSDLGFTNEDRTENIRRMGETAKLFVDAGLIVITAFISPFRRDRDRARELMPDNSFIEVFVDCDLTICEDRDPKGLYKKARERQITEFTGVSSPYEKPINPEILIDNNSEENLSKNVSEIADYLVSHGIITF